MPIYNIRGIDVDFPLQAYDCQIVYMEKVIRSLQEGKNALLESPTGTGKTLSLLCATLAWRKSFGEFSTNPSEEKGWGSSQPSSSQSVSSTPSESQRSEFVKRHNPLGNEPFDIEDLVNIGRTKGPCPYYVSRELHKSADILFAPYNYLIDPGNRRSLTGIPWSKAVLIFDEAHNLESICADAASFDLPSTYIASCISEANQCIDLCGKKLVTEKSADKQFDPDNYAILKALLTKLEKKVGEVVIQSKEQGFTRPGSYIYEFLSDLNITFETANMLMDTIENAAQLLEEGNNAASGAETKPKGTVCRLETIRDVLNIIFRDGGKSHSLFYRFHVQESQSNYSESFKGTTSRTLSWWCFNPGLAMQEFEKLGVRSIILTSGTLSPLDSFALELNLDFPIRLENPHVINPDQIWVGVVPTGPSGYPLNSSFRTRDSLEYKQELGNTIVNFARIVPDGLLVFFPSYYMMNQCIECWKSMSHACSTQASTIWERICKQKHPVIEPKQSALFSHAIEDFETKLRDQSTSGAIFLAVCRGKVSEGLDFADQAGRAVVITGMPFSMLTDPKVRLKREYLDQQAFKPKTNLKGLTGEEWYVQQAARAVNQAVGRVIRHRNDYGAIIFCDERFVQQGRQEQMSYWLRPHVKCYSKFGDVIFTMTRFFREKKNSSLLKPKKETFSVHEHCSDKDRVPEITVPSSQSPISLVSSAAQSCSGKPRLLIQASTSRTKIDNFTPLGSILPANRATLPDKFHNLPQQFKYFKRDLDSHCEEVVNLTSEEPVNSLFSLKKLKVLETGNAHLEGENKRVLPFSLCGQKSEKKEVIVGNTSSGTCGGEVESRGSAFLAQVREKLSKAEYNEFVGLMKALKSKTLSITPVLESIAKLFSFPGRFSLLKMFKDFVPTKYHEKYEELLRIHESQD